MFIATWMTPMWMKVEVSRRHQSPWVVSGP